MKKEEGSGVIYQIFCLALIGIICLLATFVIRMKTINIVNENVQDAISMSNLAAALIDREEYQNTNKIIVKDFQASYLAYEDAFRHNMNLDINWKSERSDYLKSQIDLLEFSIYQVMGSDITQIRRMNANGKISYENLEYKGQLGELKTPDGVVITNTTIYSRVGFLLKGVWTDTYYVRKEGSVDIVD